MTKKDFVLMADVIRRLDIDPRALLRVAEDFARALREVNPRFDRGRFLVACGVEEAER